MFCLMCPWAKAVTQKGREEGQLPFYIWRQRHKQAFDGRERRGQAVNLAILLR